MRSVVTLHDYFATCPFFFRLPDGRQLCEPELERATCVRCVGRIAGDGDAVIGAAFDSREAALRRELEAAEGVIVLSEAQARFLERYPPFHGLRYEVLPLPSPPLEKPAVTPSAPEPRRELNLVSWGGLEESKGLGWAVEAIGRLPRPERIALHHFGRILDEDYRRRLEENCAASLTFHGSFERSDLARFGGFDLALFPSLYLETHGYVVDEALDLGLPVIVSDRGAPKERVGERGLAVPVGDTEALAAALSRALDDPDWLRELRSGARGARLDVAEHTDRVLALLGA